MKHFDLKTLQKTVTEIQEKQIYELDKVDKDYGIYYIHYPKDNTKDIFQFTGIPKEGHFKQVLITDKTIEGLYKKLKKLYPTMHSKEWDTYITISQKMQNATKASYTCSNDQTRKQEDEAIKQYCEFCKKHNLGI